MGFNPYASAAAGRLARVKVNTDFIELSGGLDQVTPPLRRRSGVCRSTQNFEARINGGYRRIAGYERFDGRTSPSSAQYAIITATITGSPAVGNTLTGATSGATGVIIALPGSSFVITKITGTFQSGENLNVGGPTVAVSTSAALISAASTSLLHATYNNLAADQYRSDIGAVPGSGDILGVWRFSNVLYAFRNNAGGTAAALYKSSTGGWVQVSFEYQVTYTVGSGAATIVDGGTLTQGGVTATIRRVLVRTGILAAGTAAGTLVISVAAGGNFAAGAATVGAGTLTLSGAESAITLLPSGRFEFTNANFGGSANTTRVYGCDGVNKAFEFDGTYFVPIPTGMTTDTPTHIHSHKNHLFLSFVGSIQHSSPGAPYTWSIVTGSTEIAMGDTVTGFMKQPGSEAGGALAIFTRNRTSMLYGSSVSDWDLVPYREELGAYPYTIQDFAQTIFLDDRGVTFLQTSQAFGNFAHAAVTNQVLDYINDYRTLAIASCVSRDLSQYRLFFSNKRALYITAIGSKIVGIMPQLFVDSIKCVCSLEDTDGSEKIFFGSESGWVFQMEKGTSFDGDDIEYFMELAYNFCGSPRVNKKFRDATFEVEGDGYATFSLGYSLGYGSTDIPQPANQSVTMDFSVVNWDSFVWDSFVWDGQTLAPSTIAMEGEAENYSLAVRGVADYFLPFAITGAVVHYTPRKLLRA